MPAELKAKAEEFGFWCLDRPLLFGDIWPQAEMASWEDQLAAAGEAPIQRFAEELIHAALLHKGRGPRIALDHFLQDQQLQQRALAQIQACHAPSLSIMNELINNPEQCRQHLIEFLSSYWESCIAPEWPSLQTQLWEDISRRGRALARRGLPLMLAELAHTVRVDDSTGNVLFLAPGERRDTEEIDLALSENDQILLVPSHFVWPELTTIVQKDNRKGREQTTLLITYATALCNTKDMLPSRRKIS